jgi:hypothetical protein
LYNRWRTVIGVAHNAQYWRLIHNAEPFFFVAWFQDYPPFDALIAQTRVSGDPQAFAPAVQKAIHGLNPDVPTF